MEYNEELRLMRSRSAFRFLKGCEKNDISDTYGHFLEVMDKRKKHIKNIYEGKTHGRN